MCAPGFRARMRLTVTATLGLTPLRPGERAAVISGLMDGCRLSSLGLGLDADTFMLHLYAALAEKSAR
jgi:hypothetical protein